MLGGLLGRVKRPRNPDGGSTSIELQGQAKLSAPET
jgi:hypothetical protein